MKKITIPLLFLYLLVLSCKSQEEATSATRTTSTESVDSLTIVLRDSINKLIRDDIKQIVLLVDSGTYEFDNHKVFSKKLLTNSYKFRDFKPLWRSKKNREDALNALSSAGSHGLLPGDYHTEHITKLVNHFYDLTPRDHAKLDLMLTDGIILYGYHLIKGKIKPHDLSFSWNFIERDLPEETKPLLLDALKNENLQEVLLSLEPQDDEYKLLRKQLNINEELIKNGGWQKVTFSETIRPGDENESIVDLRNRLIMESYLSKKDTSSSTLYDTSLVMAVMKFQRLHGLNNDGVIGKGTLEVINTSVEDNQKKIITSLERRRWNQYPSGVPYIKVNISSFLLEFVEDKQVVYSSHVVVGRKHKQTPLFMDSLRYIVLNPTWTLPYSITSTETLRKLKKDPNYLQKHNMVLMTRKGKIISSDGIDWTQVSRGHFPYMVRQQPGPHNALGRVKFLFPNKYAIYLHDTPSKSLFSREKRAFSHGCVRLQNPLNFANFLLKREDNEKWNMTVIDSIINTSITKTISLKHRYPVLLMYQTAASTSDGEIIYYNDIYNRDDKVYKLLKKKN